MERSHNCKQCTGQWDASAEKTNSFTACLGLAPFFCLFYIHRVDNKHPDSFPYNTITGIEQMIDWGTELQKLLHRGSKLFSRGWVSMVFRVGHMWGSWMSTCSCPWGQAFYFTHMAICRHPGHWVIAGSGGASVFSFPGSKDKCQKKNIRLLFVNPQTQMILSTPL